MRLVFGLVLILGIGLAGFAVYMAQNYISQTQEERDALLAQQASAVPTVPVFVVKRAFKYGEKIKMEDVQTIPWPNNALPDGHFTDIKVLFPNDDNDLRTVIRAMETYEPILTAKVTEPGEDAGITSRLTMGMRAFAINVDVSSGVSGFLRPGDKVDIYWSGNTGNGDVTKLIEASVKLIAIDQTADEDTSDTSIARTVTVEASPKQVAALAQAQSTGRLSLSLVGAEDTSTTEPVAIDQNTLLGIVAQAPIVIEEEKVCSIRTNKGGEMVETTIPCTN